MIFDINKSMLLLKEKAVGIHEKGWIKSDSMLRSSVGITFERLIGKEIENFEWPDFEGIEIKTKCSTTNSFITLFNANPDNSIFEITRLQNTYGYPDKQYPQFKVFNISIIGNELKSIGRNFYLKVSVNYSEEKIVMNIYDKNTLEICDNVSWSFEMLEEKLLRKFNYLAYIKAKYKYQNGQLFFLYDNINFYKLLGFKEFLSLIEKGKMRITIGAGIFKSGKRFGQNHHHGTSFEIDENHLELMFKKLENSI